MDENYIYCIYCRATNKAYIGSTYYYPERISGHFKLLERNKHICKNMQIDFNEHGVASFDYFLIESNNGNSKEGKEYFYLKLFSKFGVLYNSYKGKTKQLKF